MKFYTYLLKIFLQKCVKLEKSCLVESAPGANHTYDRELCYITYVQRQRCWLATTPQVAYVCDAFCNQKYFLPPRPHNECVGMYVGAKTLGDKNLDYYFGYLG
jgi:hypothetical protein